jgi:Na+/melibiose symporter-like transporter
VGVLNREGYARYGVVASLVMLAAIVVSSLGTHECIAGLRRPPARVRRGLAGMAADLRETLANPSFRALFCAATFAAVGTGLTSGLSIYVNTYFWELTSDQLALLVLGLSSRRSSRSPAPALATARQKPAMLLVSGAAIVIGPALIVLLARRLPPMARRCPAGAVTQRGGGRP